MIDVFSSRARDVPSSELILAYVRSWDLHGTDLSALAGNVLDLMRAYLGDRPSCFWKKNGPALQKVSERGLMSIYFADTNEAEQVSLTRALVSATPEFFPSPALAEQDDKNRYDGFLHVPIAIQDDMKGLLTLGVKKKESKSREFVDPLECLGRLVGLSLRELEQKRGSEDLERKLRTEVSVTSNELEKTNTVLIDRVRELKTLSAELEKKVQELTAANNAKNEFLSIVSHELKTPLTSLNGFLCVILDGEAGDINDNQRKFLTIAKNSADRLNLLISDLLDVSRIESGHLKLEMEQFHLFDIVEKSIEGLRKLGEAKQIKLIFETFGAAASPVWGDASRVQQVIDNLIGNAIKFSNPESTVSVSCQVLDGQLEVGVKDHGPGLSPEDQKRVFDMFYQVDASTRRKAGGAGLGLAIAHGIIALHGGRLWVESQIGNGSTFKFILPRNSQEKAA